MDRNERIAHNLALAVKFYDGYRLAHQRGRVDGWEADDIAANATAFSSWMGEFPLPGASLEDGATVELANYLAVLPDLTASDFAAWPTEDGCAWRQKYHGHTVGGDRHEMWEANFIKTDADGRITRWEFFDDWIGTPRLVQAATGLTVDQVNPENYLTRVFDDSPDVSAFLEARTNEPS